MTGVQTCALPILSGPVDAGRTLRPNRLLLISPDRPADPSLVAQAGDAVEMILTTKPEVVVLDLSPESHGNAAGIGLADYTTDRLVRSIDRAPFLTNSIVSTFVERSKIPLAFPTDREAIQAALDTCWRVEPRELRLALIPNTLELTDLWVSPALAQPGELPPHVELRSEPRAIQFDAAGNLRQQDLFPHSVRGRRAGTTRVAG